MSIGDQGGWMVADSCRVDSEYYRHSEESRLLNSNPSEAVWRNGPVVRR